MKTSFLCLTILLLTVPSYAQIEAPKASPLAVLTQTVGVTDITITYSRPGVKGRTIFGEVVPYGKLWRTGANATTTITSADDFVLAGNTIPAGSYGLYTIPEKDAWTIIIHKKTDQGLSNYREEDNLVRFTVTPRQLAHKVETFTFDFSGFSDNGATLSLLWEQTAIDIPVQVNSDAKVMAQIEAQLLKDDKELDAGSYHSAATFYLKKGKDLNRALTWVDKAIEQRPEAFYFIHTRALILAELGKTKAAVKTAEQSLELAKNNPAGDFGYIARNEALIRTLKK